MHSMAEANVAGSMFYRFRLHWMNIDNCNVNELSAWFYSRCVETFCCSASWEPFLYFLNNCSAVRQCTSALWRWITHITLTHTCMAVFETWSIHPPCSLTCLSISTCSQDNHSFWTYHSWLLLLSARCVPLCVCVWGCICLSSSVNKNEGTSVIFYFLHKTQTFHFLQLSICIEQQRWAWSVRSWSSSDELWTKKLCYMMTVITSTNWTPKLVF